MQEEEITFRKIKITGNGSVLFHLQDWHLKEYHTVFIIFKVGGDL